MVWYFLDFMRKAPPDGPGWTIPLACNGSTVGNGIVGDPGNVMTSVSSLENWVNSTSRSWFVLRAPDGSHDWLFYRYDSTSGHFYITHSPTGAYSGGGLWSVPTTPNNIGTWVFQGVYPTNVGVMHCCADDAAPYGFWANYHAAGNPASSYGGFASIPIDIASPPTDGDPYVFYVTNYYAYGWDRAQFASETVPSNGYLYSSNASGTGTQIVSGHYPQNVSNHLVDATDLLPGGEDVSYPVLFARRSGLGSGFYKGISTFLQWNGRARGIGEMFADRTRISLGQVNVPWDGASDFLFS